MVVGEGSWSRSFDSSIFRQLLIRAEANAPGVLPAIKPPPPILPGSCPHVIQEMLSGAAARLPLNASRAERELTGGQDVGILGSGRGIVSLQ